MNAVKIYLKTVLFLLGLLLVSGCNQTESLSSPDETAVLADAQPLNKAGDSKSYVAASGTTLDLTSGTTGTVFFNQSFNSETRGVDVTVLGASNLNVISMTLKEFNITKPGHLRMGARIYQSTGSLLASADATVPSGFDQSVTIPISATLIAGNSYRLAFFIPEGPPGGNSGDMFDPDPREDFGSPYNELNGFLRINAAYSIIADEFPALPNIFVPMIVVEVEAGGGEDKVTICHKPGTPAEKTLVIPIQALEGHLGHGDAIGPCQ
jgi:hypothetical protein